jgi:hypothetical protein
MINYPDPRLMSPFGGIMEGIQTGLAMRGQRKETPQPSDAIINDPGERQEVDPSPILDPIAEDLAHLNEIETNLKKWGVKDEMVYQKYAKGGSFKTPLVKELAGSKMKSEDLMKILTDVKNGSPDTEGHLDAINKASSGNPKVQQAIADIQNQMMVASDQNKQQRVQVLLKYLGDVDQYTDNPKAFQGKSGITNDKTLQAVANRDKYLKELLMLDPEAFKQYAEARLAKTRSGGSPVMLSSVSNKTGKMITSRTADERQFRSDYPEIGNNEIGLTPKLGEAAPYIKAAEIETKKRNQILATLPPAEKEGQELNPKKHIKIIQKYKAAAKAYLTKPGEREPTVTDINAFAGELAKDNGWVIE